MPAMRVCRSRPRWLVKDLSGYFGNVEPPPSASAVATAPSTETSARPVARMSERRL
jgi:hypothetical protein